MPMLAFLAPLVNWIFRGVVVKFVVMTALFGLLSFLMPLVSGLIAPFLGVNLSAVFGGLGSATWFWLDFFALGYGVPLMISAYITRFVIRRLPVVG